MNAVKKSSKISILARQSSALFHTQDLAVLWNITNPNTLYTTIKRYVQRGELVRVYKGLYSLLPLSKIDPLELGLKAIHGYAYISCETVLQTAGIINQVIPEIMIVSQYSRHFTIGGHRYRTRQLQDKYLFATNGMQRQSSILLANPIRAIADVLYFNPQAHFDAPVDWSAINSMQGSIGYPVTKRP